MCNVYVRMYVVVDAAPRPTNAPMVRRDDGLARSEEKRILLSCKQRAIPPPPRLTPAPSPSSTSTSASTLTTTAEEDPRACARALRLLALRRRLAQVLARLRAQGVGLRFAWKL